MCSRIGLGRGCALFQAGLYLVAALGGFRGTQDFIIITPVGGNVDDAPSGERPRRRRPRRSVRTGMITRQERVWEYRAALSRPAGT